MFNNYNNMYNNMYNNYNYKYNMYDYMIKDNCCKWNNCYCLFYFSLQGFS